MVIKSNLQQSPRSFKTLLSSSIICLPNTLIRLSPSSCLHLTNHKTSTLGRDPQLLSLRGSSMNPLVSSLRKTASHLSYVHLLAHSSQSTWIQQVQVLQAHTTTSLMKSERTLRRPALTLTQQQNTKENILTIVTLPKKLNHWEVTGRLFPRWYFDKQMKECVINYL